MIEKGRISALQMAIIMYLTILPTAILFLPATTTSYAGRDMWLSPLWASFTGFITIYVVDKLHKLHPNTSIVQHSVYILGTIPGKIIGLCILLFFLHADTLIIWQYGEFIINSFLPQTPQIVIVGMMTLLCAFAVHGGIEVLGRLSQLIVPIFVLLLILVIIMLLPDIEIKNIFPIMGEGILPSIKGAAIPHTWFSQFVIISFLLPLLKDQKKGRKYAFFSVLAIMFTMVATNFIVYLILGNVTDSFRAPLMTAIQYITIAEFLSHLESIVMAIWIAGAFFKICVFYYVLILGLSQWFNLSDYRPIVSSIGFFLVVVSIWQVPNVSEYTSYSKAADFFLGPTTQTVFPILLLLIAYIKTKAMKNMED